MREHADPFLLPEVTRGLRHFAMPSALGSDHARYFAPLLSARRAAHEAALWSGRVAAFDAEQLRSAWDAMLDTLAADRFPRDGGDRRAVIAELEECTAEVYQALRALAAAGAAVRGAADDQQRAHRWTSWVEAVQQVFRAADDGWGAILAPLADSRGAAGRRWRALLHRSSSAERH